MVSYYTSHVHRLLSKLGRLKLLHFVVLSIVSLLVLLVYQSQKVEASLGDLLPVEVPILSQLDPSPVKTLAPQQPTAAQPTPASAQTTPAPSLLEVVVPQVDLSLPILEVKIPETKVLEVKVPDSENILPQIKVELPTVEVPKVDLPLVSLPPIQVNLPAVSLTEVELSFPALPVVTVEPKPIEIKVPLVQVHVPQSDTKLLENPTSTPTQKPSPQPVEVTLQPMQTMAVIGTPTPKIMESEAVVKEPDKLERVEPLSQTPVNSKPMDNSKNAKLRLQTTNEPKTVKATKVPLPYEDQRPYRLPIEAIWVNTTGTAGNGNGSLSTNGPVGFASQVFIINGVDTMDDSSSSRVYYTIFAKSDQWAQAPPGQPPKDFSSQTKKSK